MSVPENSSALKNHFLASILPYQEPRQAEQFLKTKDFYRPQEFIWNNPHRTSKRLYPYFHQHRDDFEAKVKPHLDKLEEQDRINTERERIRKLSHLRLETRQKFFERQKTREQLENKTQSGIRRRQSSTIERPKAETAASQLINSASYRSHSNSGYVKTIEQSYQRGIEKYDHNLEKIRKLINEQIQENHKKIRNQFTKRKQANETMQSKSKIRQRKSLGIPKSDFFL